MEFKGVIDSKLPNLETTIFTTMSRLATEYGAINLSQGFPDFPVSEELISLVNTQMELGKNQYAPMAGVPELRKEIADLQFELYSSKYDFETEITITAGATQAIYTVISALINKGDEVLMFAPAYDCYSPAVKLNGGKSVFIDLNPLDFSIPWDEVTNAINEKTKLIIINSPHNPSGAVLDKNDILQLERICSDHDVILLSDEVYAHIIFDGMKHESLAASAILRERSFIVHSFGKTFHATGWKMGFVLAPDNLMAEFRKIHQYLVFSVNTPVQFAIAEYIKDRGNIFNLNLFYQRKRDYFLSLIEDSRFTFSPAQGSYFQLLSYKDITNENDVNLAERWTREEGIASIPISVFYPNKNDNKFLRFCFAKGNEVLEKAAEILCKI